MKYKINYAMDTGLKLLMTIAFTELFIMSAFAALNVNAWMSAAQVAIVDALVLSLASSILILYWVVKPMNIMEERQRAEEALRNSLSLNTATLESTADGILVVDRNGKIVSYNTKFREIWKIPASILDSGDDGRALAFVLDQMIDPEAFLSKVEKLYGEPDAVSFDSLEFKDGRVLERYSQPQKVGDKIVGRVWSFRDVTVRKKAETALMEEKTRSEAIIAAIGDGISIQDTDFKILYQNRILKDLIGDHTGEYCYMAYERKDDRCEGCPVALSFEDGGVHKAERTAPTDKGPITVENTASPLRNSAGRIVAGIEVVRDITERKKNEDQILLAKQDWENTFNTIDDMITVHDKDFNIIRANKAAEKILGLSLLKKNEGAKCYRYYHGTESPPEGCPSCNCLQTGLPASFEIFEPHLNGFIEIRAIPRFDSRGELEGLIHIVRDINERKKMEKEHADYRDKLIQADEERRKRLRDLEKFYDMAVGRELKMKELKKEIKNLKIELTKNDRSMRESTDSRR